MMRVAFQGERGAYGEEAARAWAATEIEVVPSPRFADVFDAVAQARVDVGLVPVENSQAGCIPEVLDLLLQHALVVVGEHDFRVRHCLLAREGESLQTIEKVHSHPQALAQCRDFLREQGYRAVAEEDTAGSARLLAQEKWPRSAAIASRAAAGLYGLRILAEGVESNSTNTTRFWALRTLPVPRQGRCKTALVLGVSETPGALVHALEALRSENVQITRLESRPRRRVGFEYVYHLDVEGHREEAALGRALVTLEGRTDLLRVLGSFTRSV